MSIFADYLAANHGNKVLAAAALAHGLAAPDQSDPFRRGHNRANALLAACDAAQLDGTSLTDADMAFIGHALDIAVKNDPSMGGVGLRTSIGCASVAAALKTTRSKSYPCQPEGCPE